jgi:hypothetical protein
MKTILTLLTVPLLTPFAALHAADGAPQRKPNIVFFLIDDCSTHEFGCYGNKVNPTPNVGVGHAVMPTYAGAAAERPVRLQDGRL